MEGESTMTPFEVFYDVDTDKYYIFAPKGCVLVNGKEADIADVDSSGNVQLDLDSEEMPGALYGHVSEDEEDEGNYIVEFDSESSKSDAKYDFKVWSFGSDDFDGKQYPLCSSVVSFGGAKYVKGDYTNITFTQKQDGIGIDVFYS